MMKVMSTMRVNERGIVILLITLAFALNIFVWVAKWSQTPVGHTFVPTHNSLSDYAFYVSVIRQGMDGEYSVYDRFAVETHEGSAIHLLYLLLGRVGSLLGFQSAHTVYHIARYVLGVVWAFTIYWLISATIKEKWTRIIAMAFALFSASFPYITNVQGMISPAWFMTWWSELDPVVRIAFIPHFTVGHIMMVTTFVCVLEYIRFERVADHVSLKTKLHSRYNTWWHRESVSGKRWIVRAFVASWIAAFVHPPSAIQIVMVVPILIVILRTRKSLEVGISSCIGAVSGLLIINGISSAFPWNLPRAFEGWSYALSVKEYLLALGPIVLLAALGLISRIQFIALLTRKNHESGILNHKTILQYSPFIILCVWIITSLIMLPLSLRMPFSANSFIRTHPISNIRFLQVAIWIPLSIFAAYGMVYIGKRVSKFVLIILSLSLFVITFVGYPATITEQISHMYFTQEYQYPDPGYIAGIQALKTITSPSEHIMTLSLGGMTIPTYINRTVYVGQIVYTPDIDNKLATSWKFYSGALPVCDAYTLVMKNHIGAVFYSFDEKQAGDAVYYYPFLQPWDSYGTTKIFKVINVAPEGCSL